MSAVAEAGITLTSCQTSARSAADAAGECGRIGSWRLTRLVAQGRLCRVYRAASGQGQADQASYALKLLAAEHEDDPVAVAGIHMEAEISSRAGDPHLVAVIAAHVHEPPYYLLMPWLNGRTVACMLPSEPLPAGTAFWIVRQVAEALQALHLAGWTHNDIKPENVLLSPQGHATLLDLGFARPSGMAADQHGGMVLGTIAYMAPERLAADYRWDARSDIYSLGVTLFEMLTGRPPFAGDNPIEVIRQHRSMRPDGLRRRLPHLPTEAAALVMRMLAKEPLRRPQTAQELIDQLVRLEISLLADR